MRNWKTVVQIIAGIFLLSILALMLSSMREAENGLTVGLILIGFLTVTVCAYLIAWRGRHIQTRKIAAMVVGCISLLFGFGCMLGYAIPTLDDLHDPQISLVGTIIGIVIIWSISLAPLIVAVRCVLFVFRNDDSSPVIKE
jgi:cytochrome bd-type quinol oxidase subunit 2